MDVINVGSIAFYEANNDNLGWYDVRWNCVFACKSDYEEINVLR